MKAVHYFMGPQHMRIESMIAEKLRINQGNLSPMLREMEDMNLIFSRKVGTAVCFFTAPWARRLFAAVRDLDKAITELGYPLG